MEDKNRVRQRLVKISKEVKRANIRPAYNNREIEQSK